jgi:hypothetical protein
VVFEFFSSSGSGVHADRKYGYIRVFWKNKRFKRDKPLQFSSVLMPSAPGMVSSPFFKKKRLKKPSGALILMGSDSGG